MLPDSGKDIVLRLDMDDVDRVMIGDKLLPRSSSTLNSFKGSHKSGSRRPLKPKPKVTCSQCDSVFLWPWELRRHAACHRKEVTSRPYVGALRMLSKGATAGRSSVDPMWTTPDAGGAKQSRSGVMQRGTDWDHTPTNLEFACLTCHRKFAWHFELLCHGLCHSQSFNRNKKKRSCPECGSVQKNAMGLRAHLLTHTGETPYLCLHCWRQFGLFSDLTLHVSRHHQRPAPSLPQQEPAPAPTPEPCQPQSQPESVASEAVQVVFLQSDQPVHCQELILLDRDQLEQMMGQHEAYVMLTSSNELATSM